MVNAVNAKQLLLPAGIITGLLAGTFFPIVTESISNLVNPLVLTLLALLFFEIRFDPISKIARNRLFICLVWLSNFLIIPLFAWGLSVLFFATEPALYAGLLLYLLFPCTDWFLAFTRMAKGDVSLGSVLIPLNLVTQLLFFPLYLSFFIGLNTDFNLSGVWGTLGRWFVLPLLGATFLRFVFAKVLSQDRFSTLHKFTGSLIPWVLAGLVFCIFSCHTQQLTSHPKVFPLVLLAVFIFFILTWILGELFAWCFKLKRPQHVLLAMSTTARNSPLMLGLATVVLPEQPLVYAALIIGMLVEFPHLAFLTHVFQRRINLISNSAQNSAVV